MKKHEIKVGGKYRAKVSGKLTTVRVDAIRETNSYRAHQPRTPVTRYDVTNLATGRKTTFRSAARFRCEDTLRDDIQQRLETIRRKKAEALAGFVVDQPVKPEGIECAVCGDRRAAKCTSSDGRHSEIPEPAGVVWVPFEPLNPACRSCRSQDRRFRITPYPNSNSNDWELRDELTGFYSHFSVEAAQRQAEEILAREAARAAFDPIALGM